MSIVHEPHGKHARRQAVVVGAAGQDGRLLCAELEGDGYEVVRVERGGIRRADGTIEPLDIRDPRAWQRLFEKCSPNEIYYLAAHHHSSEEGQGDLGQLLNESFAVHAFGLMRVLDEIVRMQSGARLFYASSSLIFGEADHAPQSETTPIRPICAYGVTKAAGMGLCEVYRRERKVFCCSGILYNHESSHRGGRFVSKKIVSGVVDVHLGFRKKLMLGSLEAQVDWGAAIDYVHAMRLMLALDEPKDFVIASGELRNVRDFVELAFGLLGLDYAKHVRVLPELMQRTARRTSLVGDASNLRDATGWHPRVSFKDLVQDMVRTELASRDVK